MAHIIIIRNCHCYYITKSATLDNMDGSDAILCWQSTNHNVRLLSVCIYCVTSVYTTSHYQGISEFIATVLAWSHGSELPVSRIATLIVLLYILYIYIFFLNHIIFTIVLFHTPVTVA